MLVHPGFLGTRNTGRERRPGAFFLALGQRLVQGGLGLLEGNTGTATVDPLAGEALGGHLDVGSQ
ncbi:hypothetical protein D3C80_1989710 [compost metagenome]